MDFVKITNEYYSKWLGVMPECMYKNGVIFIKSQQRDQKQTGYSCVFDVYAYVTSDLIVISYSKRISVKIEEMKKKVVAGMTTKEVAKLIENTFNKKVNCNIKFCFKNSINKNNSTDTIKLTESDYAKYLQFFMTENPNANVDGWLKEYFNDICKSGFAIGIFEDGKLVSATDAPSMPYMEDKIQEVGINTLPEYRRKGYAKLVTLECIKSIIESGKCPLWSCNINNISSEKLAYSVGFRKLADVLTISI